MAFVVKNFREINKEVVREFAASVRETNQMTFGSYLENNLKIVLNENSEINQVNIVNTSDIYDYIFGADFKISFSSNNDLIDGMSQYCDVTVSRTKDGVDWLKKTRYGFGKCKYDESAEAIATLSNGFTLHLGYKMRNGGKFLYQKPVLVVALWSDAFITNCIFSKEDANIIINNIRQASYTLAYHYAYNWCGEERKGAGKRASDNICVSSGFEEAAFTTEK